MARLVDRPKSSGHKVLIVDDAEEIVESTRVLLEKEGHEVHVAMNGPAGIEKVRELEPHLLILDYFMPGMTGEEVVAQIRPFNREVQILLSTGYASEKPPREMLRRLDIQGYHDKTDGPDKLLLWVDVSLKSYRQARMLWTMVKRSGVTREEAKPPSPPSPSPSPSSRPAPTAVDPNDPWAVQAAIDGREYHA